jgi:hypothetical protein
MRTTDVQTKIADGMADLIECGLADSSSSYLARGNYGAVLDHGSTVTKLFYRHTTPSEVKHSQSVYEEEIKALKLLSGTSLGTVRTPRLIEDFGGINHPSVLAAYEMEKIDGFTMPKKGFFENQSNRFKENFYNQLGTLIAEFQNATAERAIEQETEFDPIEYLSDISFISELDLNRSSALLKADKYLKDRIIPAIAHGDMHLGNIVVNNEGDILGLIDFGNIGISTNHLLDIVSAASYAEPTNAHYASNKISDAFHSVMGTKPDRTMVSLTGLAYEAMNLKRSWGNANLRRESLGRLDKLLISTSHLTGYIPQ